MLGARLDRCRARAAGYLEAQVLQRDGAEYWRHSPVHDVGRWPGHLLYGSWAGAHASVLLGLDAQFDEARRARIARGFAAFRRADGSFTMTGAPAAALGGHDDEYLTLHCTNYALGAERALALPSAPLRFMEHLATAPALAAWLDGVDMQQPWREGNRIVNLASFYAVLADDGCAWARERLAQLVDWHDAHQHPVTGFWHADAGDDLALLERAMAGAAHNLHLYYYLGRAVPRAARIVDSCLRLGFPGVSSACIDIDLVDILVHLRGTGHRVHEIDGLLERYLLELLEVQHADGGFGDNYVTPQSTYGLETPRGISVTWTTWFRLATIGMIAATLLAEERARWRFRATLGMGYCNLRHAPDRAPPAAIQRTRAPLWYGVVREGRFLRQRFTHRLRRLAAGA